MAAEQADQPPSGSSPGQRRSVARLAGVQALYQIELSDGDVDAVVEEFLRYRMAREIEGTPIADVDRDHFARTVHDAMARREEIDALVSGALAKSWTLPRLGALMRALLRAAAGELLARPDVPAKVVIDEYVELARAFFSEREPGFVNAALDHLARQLRPGELAAPEARHGAKR